MPARILIVRAGIGGLTAALSLQQFGFQVQVFEQAPQLGEIGAGVVITPNATHVLNFLGVGKAIAEQGSCPSLTYTRHFATGEVLEVRESGQALKERYGADYFQVHRADLHDQLRIAVLKNDPDCIHLSHQFVSADQDSKSVTARFDNGEAYTGDAMIGCDGNASKVRSYVFGHKDVDYTGQVAFRALIPSRDVNDMLENEDKRLYIGPGRMFLQYYIRRDEILNVVGIAREPKWQDEGWTIPAENAEFAALFSDFTPYVREIIAKIPKGRLHKWGLRDREPMAHWLKGRIATLGDAAHPMTPFLGQGACMAIEDGLVLARCLDKYEDIHGGLSKYEWVRKPRANGVQLASREQGRALQGEVRDGDKLSPGRGPVARGLFAYNPVTVAI